MVVRMTHWSTGKQGYFEGLQWVNISKARRKENLVKINRKAKNVFLNIHVHKL